MKRIYVVMGCLGGIDEDQTAWLVAAFVDEQKAEQRARDATEAAKLIVDQWVEASTFEIECERLEHPVRLANPFDEKHSSKGAVAVHTKYFVHLQSRAC